MPVSLEFLRGVLGVMCVFFAYMAGRVLVDYRRARVRQSRLMAWVMRTTVCALAMIFPQRAVDGMAILVWALSLAVFAGGMWAASRTRKAEDLSKTIFPDEP